MWLSACATAGTSVVVSPDLPVYSEAFQARAAEELDALPPPCDRDLVLDGCSALGRLVLDHAWLREKVRALRGEE